MFVGTKKAFQNERVFPRVPRTCIAIAQDKASVYGHPIDNAARARSEARQARIDARELEQAKARAANLARVHAQTPISNAEALELIRKHREAEARLLAEEAAEEAAERKAKRMEFVRQRQGALAGLSKR